MQRYLSLITFSAVRIPLVTQGKQCCFFHCPLLCPDNFPAGCKNPVPSAAPARLSCLLLQVAPGLGDSRERGAVGGHTIGRRVTMLGGRLPCRVDGSRQRGEMLLIFSTGCTEKDKLIISVHYCTWNTCKIERKKSTLNLFCINTLGSLGLHRVVIV